MSKNKNEGDIVWLDKIKRGDLTLKEKLTLITGVSDISEEELELWKELRKEGEQDDKKESTT